MLKLHVAVVCRNITFDLGVCKESVYGVKRTLNSKEMNVKCCNRHYSSHLRGLSDCIPETLKGWTEEDKLTWMCLTPKKYFAKVKNTVELYFIVGLYFCRWCKKFTCNINAINELYSNCPFTALIRQCAFYHSDVQWGLICICYLRLFFNQVCEKCPMYK